MKEELHQLIREEVTRALRRLGRDPLLLPEEAGKQLRVSVRTLARWRTEGGGPKFVKAGATVRYRSSVLEAWVAEREVGSTSET